MASASCICEAIKIIGCRTGRIYSTCCPGSVVRLRASFGLLYWRDDEGDVPAGENNFQVIVMTRGQLTTRLDPFLSPTIPGTEDAWDGHS
ncbi:Imm7 family immunity protein [Deinococcus rufus]|uniref:Imm7 family immunity protein n=1 Tax=Deinococcus rufus TaxID=2136097 RepID=A0ABV7Z5Y8_9DEIO